MTGVKAGEVSRQEMCLPRAGLIRLLFQLQYLDPAEQHLESAIGPDVTEGPLASNRQA